MPQQAQVKGKETGTQRCAQEQRRDKRERRKTKDEDERPKHHAVRANKYGQAGLEPRHSDTCKTTFASLTQSQAISQSFRVFISFRSMRDTTFFIFRNSFLYKITVSFTMVIKRSPGGPYRWRAVNFEIHLWSSAMNADCIWRSISI